MPNILADFPADRFAIHAYCACGHQAVVDTAQLPQTLTIDAMRSRLRCAAFALPSHTAQSAAAAA